MTTITDVVTQTPEEASKAAAAAAIEALVQNGDILGIEIRSVDAGDYLTFYVRKTKRGGRTFVMRVTCDDLPRIAPAIAFVDPAGWTDESKRDLVRPEHYPKGEGVSTDRGPLPVICIAGQRDYYAGAWHSGWTNPPTGEHEVTRMVANFANAISDAWE